MLGFTVALPDIVGSLLFGANMTKKELVDKLGEISYSMDRLTSGLKSLREDAQDIFTALEDLPSEASEIEDYEVTEEN